LEGIDSPLPEFNIGRGCGHLRPRLDLGEQCLIQVPARHDGRIGQFLNTVQPFLLHSQDILGPLLFGAGLSQPGLEIESLLRPNPDIDAAKDLAGLNLPTQ
jgi:hypothetical protein